MTAVTLPALQGCWKSQVWIKGAPWPAKFCTQTGSIQNGMRGEEVERCPKYSDNDEGEEEAAAAGDD